MEVLKTRRDFVPNTVTILKTGPEINAILLDMLADIVAAAPAAGSTLEISNISFAPSVDTYFYTRYASVEAENSVRPVSLYYYANYIIGTTNLASVQIAFVTDAQSVFLPPDSSGMFANLGAVSSHAYIPPAVDMATVPVRFERVGNASRMFAGLSFFGSIIVPSGTLFPAYAASTGMFSGCTSLVGGAGTAYDANHTDGEYARIDNPPNAPGYFTAAT